MPPTLRGDVVRATVETGGVVGMSRDVRTAPHVVRTRGSAIGPNRVVWARRRPIFRTGACFFPTRRSFACGSAADPASQTGAESGRFLLSVAQDARQPVVVRKQPFYSAGLAGVPLAESGLAARVSAAPDGEVRMHFTSRPGLCGNVEGDNVMIGRSGERGRTWMGTTDGRGPREIECIEGPAYVRLRVRGGRVSDVSARVARDFAAASVRVTDVGRVPVREAASYLLALAEGSDHGEVSEDAIFPVTLADSVDISGQLLRIARSDAAGDRARRSAVFWLSQVPGDEVTRGLVGLVDDDDQSRELREGGVFSLSRRPREESIPELIRIARTHRDGAIRRAALFWLGESGDARARALIEEMLEN